MMLTADPRRSQSLDSRRARRWSGSRPAHTPRKGTRCASRPCLWSRWWPGCCTRWRGPGCGCWRGGTLRGSRRCRATCGRWCPRSRRACPGEPDTFLRCLSRLDYDVLVVPSISRKNIQRNVSTCTHTSNAFVFLLTVRRSKVFTLILRAGRTLHTTSARSGC